MHRITNIPVKTADGEPVGNAMLEVDPSGNVQIHMMLDAVLGQEIMRMMEAALVEGLSIRPIATPAMEKRGIPAQLPEYLQANMRYGVGYIPPELNRSYPADLQGKIVLVDAVSPHPTIENVSLGMEEIESRFGFHKAAIEGPNATAPKHAEARTNFKSFAKWFDRHTPPGREKDLAMERLEESSMWFHKAIAKQSPIAEV